MKRIIIALLLIVFVVPSACALTIDPTTATLDELIQARTEIERYIMENKDFKQVAVPSGSYVVGDQIPAGEYVIDCQSLAVVSVYNDASKTELRNMYAVSEDSPIGRLVLTDEDVIDITGVGVLFSPYAGLGF